MGALVLMRMVGRSGVKISILDVFHARARSQLAVLNRRPERHAGRHAVAFLPASDEILSACQPGLVAPAPGSGTGLAGNTAAVISALGLTAAVRAPATLGIWPARCANCPAGQR
jgi:hypothetical protein